MRDQIGVKENCMREGMFRQGITGKFHFVTPYQRTNNERARYSGQQIIKLLSEWILGLLGAYCLFDASILEWSGSQFRDVSSLEVNLLWLLGFTLILGAILVGRWKIRPIKY